MAANYDDIMLIRQKFMQDVLNTEATLNRILDDIKKLQHEVDKQVKTITQSQNLAHIVGTKIQSIPNPIQKLQEIRKSIYPNTEITTYFKTEILPKCQELLTDAKTQYSLTYTGIIGDELTLKLLSTNADKERETSYLLARANSHLEAIKSKTSIMKSLFDFVYENLDSLNKMESSLRLQHNMSSTLYDVGNNTGESIGSEGISIVQGYDPVFDDLN